MEIPKYWELFPHVLELLKDGGVKSQREIYEELIIKLGIPERDGIIEGDRLGFEKIGLQAKRYTDSPVSVKSINEFIGSLNRKGLKKGVFITTSRFTSEALRASEEASIGGIKLSPIDGMKLAKLMIEYNMEVYVKERYEIKAIDENFFENL